MKKSKKGIDECIFFCYNYRVGRRIPKKQPKGKKGMVLDMLDVENVKTILQAEVYKREKAKAKWKKYRSSENKSLEELYENRYNMYCYRFDGMCDMLFDLGFLAWSNDDNMVNVVKRVDGNIISLVDEIPF